MSKVNLHYFDQAKANEKDLMLKMAIKQGYVPPNCLLAGFVVMALVNESKDPCKGCEGNREICKGRDK